MSWSLRQHSPVRNTAQLVCITSCILARRARSACRPRRCGNLSRRPSGSSANPRSSGCLSPPVIFSRSGARRRAEHHEIDQRVEPSPVAPVHRHAAGFAERHQAGHHESRCRSLGQHFAVIVGRDAPMCSARRQHRDRLARDVDAGEDAGDSEMPAGARAALRIEMVECMKRWSSSDRTPRPSRISIVMARETTSREARSLARAW